MNEKEKNGLEGLTGLIKSLKDDFGKFITNDWSHLTAKVNLIEGRLTKRVLWIMIGFAVVTFLITFFV